MILHNFYNLSPAYRSQILFLYSSSDSSSIKFMVSTDFLALGFFFLFVLSPSSDSDK